jgi:hypothetical protein
MADMKTYDPDFLKLCVRTGDTRNWLDVSSNLLRTVQRAHKAMPDLVEFNGTQVRLTETARTLLSYRPMNDKERYAAYTATPK